jgi:hypothetical protein
MAKSIAKRMPQSPAWVNTTRPASADDFCSFALAE